MEINPALLQQIQSITLNSQKLSQEGLSLGQQVLARVVAAQSQNLVTLHIGNTILNAKTNLPLVQGQTLQLLVAQLTPEVILKPTPKAAEAALLNQSMRQTLPREMPLRDVMTTLNTVARADPKSMPNIPPAVIQAVRQFVSNLPTSKDVATGDGLKKALESAGTFFENRLKQAAEGKPITDITRDLKSLLLQLRQLVAQHSKQPAANPPRSETPSQGQTNPPPQQAAAGNASPGTQTTKLQAPGASTTPPPPAKPDTSTGQSGATNPARAAAQPTPQTQTNQNVRTGNPATASQAATNQPAAQNATAQTHSAALKSQVPQPSSTATPPRSNVSVVQQGIQATTLRGVLPGAGETSVDTLAKTTPQNTALHAQAAGKTQAQGSARDLSQLLNNASAQPNARAQSTGALAALFNSMDAVTELVRQVESALARTQLHQLNTLQDAETGKLALAMEVPVQNNDELSVLKLKIEKDGKNKNGYEDIPITVTLEVDLEHIGAVHSRIVLLRSNVALSFWAEQADTYQMIQRDVAELEERLQHAGLSTESIQFHHGSPAGKSEPIPDTTGLLDIKA